MVCQCYSPFPPHFLLFFLLLVSYSFASSIKKHKSHTSTGVAFMLPPLVDSLQGKHLTYFGATTVSQLSLTRNASGYIIDSVGIGPNMMDWLSINYGFTYSIFQSKTNLPFEDVDGAPGLISYVLKGECDILVSASMTTSRFKRLDFTHPSTYLPIGYLIPKPELTVSLTSIVKPFSNEVWIVLIGSTLFVISILHFMNWFLEKVTQSDRKMVTDASLYVVSVILRQPINWSIRREPIMRRILIVWSLAAFIFTNIYNCLLISFLTSPNSYPMVSSITEVASRPDIKVLVDQGTNTEAILLNAERGLFKQLGDKLRAYPQSRCSNSNKCAHLVKSGSHVYFGASSTYLSIAMKNDYKESHSCNFQFGKGTLLSLTIPWGVHKNSPYLADINKGIIRMQETGLLDLWIKKFQPDIRRCTKLENDASVAALSLLDTAGVFVILGMGYALAFFALSIENIYWGFKNMEIIFN